MARSGIVRWAGPSINQQAGRKSPRSLKIGKVYLGHLTLLIGQYTDSHGCYG